MNRRIATHPGHARRHSLPVDHGFERRLGMVLLVMGLLLALNAWIVTRSHEPELQPWGVMHPALVSGSVPAPAQLVLND